MLALLNPVNQFLCFFVNPEPELWVGLSSGVFFFFSCARDTNPSPDVVLHLIIYLGRSCGCKVPRLVDLGVDRETNRYPRANPST